MITDDKRARLNGRRELDYRVNRAMAQRCPVLEVDTPWWQPAWPDLTCAEGEGYGAVGASGLVGDQTCASDEAAGGNQ